MIFKWGNPSTDRLKGLNPSCLPAITKSLRLETSQHGIRSHTSRNQVIFVISNTAVVLVWLNPVPWKILSSYRTVCVLKQEPLLPK